MTERNRLAALRATQLLDTPAEERFSRITRLAKASLGAKIALVSLIDEHRQWFKSCVGADLTETPRDIAFCDHAIRTPEDVMVVLDATKDPRFATNPLVTGDLQIRFYVGAPLVTPEGYALGTLCIIDTEPRAEFSAQDMQTLKDLAETVMIEIEAGAKQQEIEDLTLINQELQHRMGNMYAHITALISLAGRLEVDKDELVKRLRDNLSSLARMQASLASQDFHSIGMAELAETVLAPFRTGDGDRRIHIAANNDFQVSARGAFILTLMLHELATNAVKHGALRDDKGHVELYWNRDERMNILWQEIGTKLKVSHNQHKGFGSQILMKIVPMDMQGQAEYHWADNHMQYQVSGNPERLLVMDSANTLPA